jgi:hypothetical protein
MNEARDAAPPEAPAGEWVLPDRFEIVDGVLVAQYRAVSFSDAHAMPVMRLAREHLDDPALAFDRERFASTAADLLNEALASGRLNPPPEGFEP